MAVAQKDIAATVPVIPVGKENDVKFYAADGSVTMGKSALELMPKSGLVLWLAGNQFFAMDEVVSAFQRKRPGTSVGLITLPPGLLLQAIRAGGWTYNGMNYPGGPDIYGSVNLGHLKELRKSELMSTYIHAQ